VVVVDSFRLCLSFALSLSGLRSSSVDSPASILSRRTRHSRRQAIIARNHTTLPSSAWSIDRSTTSTWRWPPKLRTSKSSCFVSESWAWSAASRSLLVCSRCCDSRAWSTRYQPRTPLAALLLLCVRAVSHTALLSLPLL